MVGGGRKFSPVTTIRSYDLMFLKMGGATPKNVNLRSLVLARICHPRSKLATVEYLKSHFQIVLGLLVSTILGARIKSESEAVRQWIFSLGKKNKP